MRKPKALLTVIVTTMKPWASFDQRPCHAGKRVHLVRFLGTINIDDIQANTQKQMQRTAKSGKFYIECIEEKLQLNHKWQMFVVLISVSAVAQAGCF